MPQVSAREFELLPLRVHAFLAGVPLHDAWTVDLPHWRAGITLDEFLRATANNRPFTPSLVGACSSISAFSSDGSSDGIASRVDLRAKASPRA